MTAPATDSRPRGSSAVVRAVRPRQSVKNLLVAAAPLAAGQIADPAVALSTLGAIVAFWSVSMSAYLTNDLLDQEADRAHPVKRHRPIASGELGPRHAGLLAGALALTGLGLGGAVSADLGLLLGGYLVLQVAYSLWLKHQVVVDLAIVASGFLLRAIAGGLATDLPLSQWFLLVAGFGSLYVVAGKRLSEHLTVGMSGDSRQTLAIYSESYLRLVLGVAAGLTIVSYSLWAFEVPTAGLLPWRALSIAPFVIAMLRYAIDVDQGRAGEPEVIIWSDRGLQVICSVWVTLFLLGAHDA